MNIVHVATRWKRGGGAERNILLTIDQERSHGHKVLLIVGKDCDVDRLPTDLEVLTIRELVRTPSPLRDLRAYLKLRRVIRRRRPDIVHTHESKAGALGRLAAKRHAGKVIHGVHMMSFGRDSRRLADRVYRSIERVCARWTDVFVAVGWELVEGYRAAGIGREKEWLVVRSPVDVEAFAAARGSDRLRSKYREELGTGTEALLVAAGALEPRKRHGLLVERLALLLERGAVLAVAGEGPSADEIRERAIALDVGHRVRMLGYVPDLSALVAGADCLVHAAQTEGVPQVVVQAVAAGVPVVATEVEGLREIAGAAISIVPRDGTGLVEAVEATLTDPPVPVSLDKVTPWTAEAVIMQLADLRKRTHGEASLDEEAPSEASVAVGIPTHSRPGLLEGALVSATSQSLKASAVFVVDDAGDPSTAALVDSFRDQGHPVCLLRNQGSGPSSSRNIALQHADSDFITFLDDDDRWEPTFLHETVARLVSTGADAAVSWTAVESDDCIGGGDAILSGLDGSDAIARNPGFTGSNVVYRSAALSELGGFDPELPVSNDKDLLVRFLDAGLRYVTVPSRLSRRTIGHPRLGTDAARVAGMGRYLQKHHTRLSRSDRRYLLGRIARVERRRSTGISRIVQTARMLALLRWRGLREMRADDMRITADAA